MESQLSIEERQRFWKAIDSFEETSQKLDEMYVVIVGNDKFGQEGLVHRIKEVEDKVDEIEKTLAKAKNWIAGAVAVGGLVGFIISKLITKI